MKEFKREEFCCREVITWRGSGTPGKTKRRDSRTVGNKSAIPLSFILEFSRSSSNISELKTTKFLQDSEENIQKKIRYE